MRLNKRMSDEQTNFKVTDRRLFNPDGSPRDLPEDMKAEAQATATAQAAGSSDLASPTTQKTSDPAPANIPPHDAGTATEGDDAELPDADDPTSFVNFMMSIASNAASALGMMEHPVTHQREVDLELAKHWIDILGMLQQKTRSNLAPQEAKILEGLLADLRMQYVSLTSSASAKTARPYTGRDIVGG
jgi:uncharacterized protein DUF1844